MDQFSRTRQLLGDEALERIQQAKVAVFGLGAVGFFAVEALARTGVGRLLLTDFDVVDSSNINRQLLALHSTVGRRKAVLAAERIKDINPACAIEIHDEFINDRTLAGLLSEDIDVVVDAIDGLNSKVNLLVSARQMGLCTVSSMGAAGKIDPARVKTGDISETCVCPLARVVRRRLHRRGVFDGIRAVYSDEKPMNKQPFKAEDSVDVLEDHGRPRPPIGSVSWVPGVFGLFAAKEVIDFILSGRKSPRP